jgi:hypothetical protein
MSVKRSFVVLSVVLFGIIFPEKTTAETILILQVGAATDGNIQRSFVELYNNSDELVSLNGYSLQYADGTRVRDADNQPNTAIKDLFWQKIDLKGTIPPKHSFLILGDAALSGGSTPMAKPALTFASTNYGDMYVMGLMISNRSFKVALMSNTTMLTDAIQNPFDTDGNGTKAVGYVDMAGAVNTVGEDKINGFEKNPITDLNKHTGQRRTYLVDTDDNAADFTRAVYLNASPEDFEKWRPKNLAFGAWNPLTGLKDGETPVGKDPIVAGAPDALAGKLLILQAYGSSNDAAGVSHPFVELYNNSDAAINLKGISLFYADGTSVSGGALPNTNTEDRNWKSIPLSGTLPAKTSFLISGAKQNKTGRLQINDNYGDMNVSGFTISNRAFKIALIRNRNNDLTRQNPFDMDGNGAKAQGYIDMLGAANEYAADGSARDRIFGFETAPARNSASEAVRRLSLVDTDDNSADFASIRYAAGGISDEQLEIFRPRNRVFGSWEPFTGENKDGRKVLPVIRIYTEDGAFITSKVNYKSISFSLTDPDHPENNVFSNHARDEMRGRGNASWNNNKKPYRIKFREKTSLFERVAHRNWVLLAEYRDPTFLTTPVAFELGRNVFDHQPYTATYQNVHLYLNGRYDGVYCLTEHRQADPDGVGAPGRVGVDPLEGWFVEMSIYLEQPMFRTKNYDMPILIKTNNAPTGNPDDGNNPHYDYVKNDWNKLCDLMKSEEFPENGYRDLIDLNTVIDFMLINEIVLNTDGPSLGNSLFFYKDKGGKIGAGPLWDFEISFGWDWGIHNHVYFVPGTSTQLISKNSFLRRFYDDPVFLVKYKEHWNKKYDELVAFPDFIKSYAEKIRPAVLQDTERWNIPSGGYNWTHFDPNHARLTDNMVNWWKTRMPWLNTELNKVVLAPASRNFGTIPPNSSDNPSQTLTLVSFYEMKDLTARFEKTNTPFEITGHFNQTATGDGGFLATIHVRPKSGLSEASHNDVLIFSGTNQGKSFSLRASLSCVVRKAAGADAPTPMLETKTHNSITVKPGEPLSNGQSVEIAINQNSTVPTTGWRQTNYTFNFLTPGTDYYFFARSLENGGYLAGKASAPLKVTTEKITNSNEIEQPDPLKAWVRNGMLHITGLTAGETVSIYNAAGALVYQTIANEKEKDIPLNVQGLYIVRAGDRTVRVVFTI